MWVAAKGYAAPSASDGTEASVDELESSHDGAGDDVRDSPGYILGFGNVVYDLIDI
jgi:hypothetical protein